jgi:glycosyltransferase involved in cell wall biosynthesis
MSRQKISAFVIAFNRANILGTCLRALEFADELIVVDKSSTDGSRAIAEAYADVVTVPWTPTVEETRTLALSLCRHEWVLFLDDDECLSAAAAGRILSELEDPSADIYEFPLRHYILGQHDERAYYWPEHHVRLFRRGAVTFSRTVHAGIMRHSERVMRFPVSDGVCIHHLSHSDVSGWIEKTNRYTSRADRVGIKAGPDGFAAFAHQRIDYWMGRTKDDAPDGYPAAAALLRAVYDMVDAVKSWEAERGLDGAALFAQTCKVLDDARSGGEPRLRVQAADGTATDTVLGTCTASHPDQIR